MQRATQKYDSLHGSLDMLILRTLAVRDLRGRRIVQLLQQSSDRELLAEEGSLYPALQRLELHGWIEGAWDVTPDHRRAKVYSITAAGRKRLEAQPFRACRARVEDVPATASKIVRSRLLFGCVVTGVAVGQQSARDLPPVGIPVDVCMAPTQDLLLSTHRSKALASAIFSPIGVDLTWHTGLSDCDPSVRPAFQIRWAERAPSSSPAGTLAAARPYGSSENSITIYEAPLRSFLRQYPNAPELMLAYVLAHELAHVMQGVDRHSASGILTATWSYREYYGMLSGRLVFTAQDVALIRTGLEVKRSKIATQESAPGLPKLNLTDVRLPP